LAEVVEPLKYYSLESSTCSDQILGTTLPFLPLSYTFRRVCAMLVIHLSTELYLALQLLLAWYVKWYIKHLRAVLMAIEVWHCWSLITSY